MRDFRQTQMTDDDPASIPLEKVEPDLLWADPEATVVDVSPVCFLREAEDPGSEDTDVTEIWSRHDFPSSIPRRSATAPPVHVACRTEHLESEAPGPRLKAFLTIGFIATAFVAGHLLVAVGNRSSAATALAENNMRARGRTDSVLMADLGGEPSESRDAPASHRTGSPRTTTTPQQFEPQTANGGGEFVPLNQRAAQDLADGLAYSVNSGEFEPGPQPEEEPTELEPPPGMIAEFEDELMSQSPITDWPPSGMNTELDDQEPIDELGWEDAQVLAETAANDDFELPEQDIHDNY